MEPFEPPPPDASNVSSVSTDSSAPTDSATPMLSQPAVIPSPPSPRELKRRQEGANLSIVVGMQFLNFTQAKDHVYSWAAARHVSLIVRDSRSEKHYYGLGKDFVFWTCVHGKLRKSRGTGQRQPKKTPKIGCPFQIRLAGKYIYGKPRLVVTEFVDEHNHPVTEEMYNSLPKNRRPRVDKAIELLLQDNVPANIVCDYAHQTQGVKPLPRDIFNMKTSLRKKWKYLRDQFAVEAGKSLPTGAGIYPDVNQKPKWRYYKRLTFLKDVVKPRPPPGSFSGFIPPRQGQSSHSELSQEGEPIRNGDLTMECEDRSESSSPQMTDNQAVEEDWEPNVKMEPFSHDEEETSTSTGRKRARTEEYHPGLSQFEMEQQRLQYLYDRSNRYEEMAEMEDDHDLMFFRTLLPHVHNIPEHKKLTFRNCIQEIVQQFAYPSQYSQSVPSTPHSQQSCTSAQSPQASSTPSTNTDPPPSQTT